MKHFPRATSPEPLAGLGDPERWGAHSEVSLLVPTAAGVYTMPGPQVVRVQVPDLMARSWVLFATFSATGLDESLTDSDTPGYFLEVTGGVGQTSLMGRLDLLQLMRLRGYWGETVNSRFQTVRGVAQIEVPIPAAALAIRPVVSVEHVNGLAAPHVVKFAFDVSVAPWSLA